MAEALRISSDAGIIEHTHWTFAELDDQPHDRLEELKLYLRLRAGLEKQKDEMASQRRRAETHRQH